MVLIKKKKSVVAGGCLREQSLTRALNCSGLRELLFEKQSNGVSQCSVVTLKTRAGRLRECREWSQGELRLYRISPIQHMPHITIQILAVKWDVCHTSRVYSGTQRLVLEEYLFGRPEIFVFNWRKITSDLRNKGIDFKFLLFSEGQICRLECDIRSASIFGRPLGGDPKT